MNREGFSKWIMLGRIVPGSRSEELATRSEIPYVTFTIHDVSQDLNWNAVAYGPACEHVEQQLDDDALYIFEGTPQQHKGEAVLKVLYVRQLPVAITEKKPDFPLASRQT